MKLTPREYLSWSSMDLFERSKEKWAQVYIYGEKLGTNRGQAFGRTMAESFENDELTGDINLDIAMAKVPRYEIRDQSITAELKDGKKRVVILIKPDTVKKDYSAFQEDKTGPVGAWTQKKADESGQVTFYATGLYLKSGRIPGDIRLNHFETEKVWNETGGFRIKSNGEVRTFITKRDMAQVLKMMVRMKRAQEGIEKLCEEILF